MICDICNQPVSKPTNLGRPRKRHPECRSEFNRRRIEARRIADATEDPAYLAAQVRDLAKRLRIAKARLAATRSRVGVSKSLGDPAAFATRDSGGAP